MSGSDCNSMGQGDSWHLPPTPLPPRESGYPFGKVLSLCWAGTSPAPGSHSCQHHVLRLPRRFGSHPTKSHPRGLMAPAWMWAQCLGPEEGFPSPKKLCLAVTACSAARCGLLETWELQLCWGWERTEISLQMVTPRHSSLLWSSLRVTQKYPHRLDLLCCKEGMFHFPSPAQQAVCGGCSIQRGRSKFYSIKGFLPATKYPRGVLMHFSENGGAKWSW